MGIGLRNIDTINLTLDHGTFVFQRNTDQIGTPTVNQHFANGDRENKINIGYIF